MRRFLLCGALVIGINAMVFSQVQGSGLGQGIELWGSVGPAFGNYFMSGSNIENNYTGSPGTNLSFYVLLHKNIGLFFNYGILTPLINSAGLGDGPSVQLDFALIGIAFGYDLNDKLKLYGGIGPHQNALFLHDDGDDNTRKTNYTVGWGIGGDVGIKYNITNLVSLNAGTTLSWNFVGNRENGTRKKGDWSGTYPKEDEWIKGYSMFGIKPYIGVGFGYK